MLSNAADVVPYSQVFEVHMVSSFLFGLSLNRFHLHFSLGHLLGVLQVQNPTCYEPLKADKRCE